MMRANCQYDPVKPDKEEVNHGQQPNVAGANRPDSQGKGGGATTEVQGTESGESQAEPREVTAKVLRKARQESTESKEDVQQEQEKKCKAKLVSGEHKGKTCGRKCDTGKEYCRYHKNFENK
jgi:hypothetical protein